MGNQVTVAKAILEQLARIEKKVDALTEQTKIEDNFLGLTLETVNKPAEAEHVPHQEQFRFEAGYPPAKTTKRNKGRSGWVCLATRALRDDASLTEGTKNSYESLLRHIHENKKPFYDVLLNLGLGRTKAEIAETLSTTYFNTILRISKALVVARRVGYVDRNNGEYTFTQAGRAALGIPEVNND